MPITLDGTLGVTTPGVATPGITLAGGAITANAAQLNSSSEDINSENRIINGDFGVWQRGTSSAAYGYVAADRWENTVVGGTGTQSRQAFALGDTLGATQPTFFLRQTVSGQTLANHVALIRQSIEGVRSYAGQTVTILGWARRSSGTGNMVATMVQQFGTGGSPSSAVSVPSTTVTLTGSWAPFAAVMNVPSVTGKTLGTNGNDFLHASFFTSAGSDYSAGANSLGLQTIGVDLWGIHIRVGTWTAADASLYRPRDPGTELALCQRYYELGSVRMSIQTANTAGFNYTQSFKVSKRGVPTIAFNSIGYLAANNLTAFTVSESDFAPQATATASGAVSFSGNFTANAEL